jgi:hypothetical protein
LLTALSKAASDISYSHVDGMKTEGRLIPKSIDIEGLWKQVFDVSGKFIFLDNPCILHKICKIHKLEKRK